MAEKALLRHEANPQKEISFAASRADAVRLALLLTYITLGWMTVEGAAALLLGWEFKSLLLEAFVLVSVMELFSPMVILWPFLVEASGGAVETGLEAVELGGWSDVG